VLLAAILMPAGFFGAAIGRDAKRPNQLIVLLWNGAASLGIGLATAGIGSSPPAPTEEAHSRPPDPLSTLPSPLVSCGQSTGPTGGFR
jgi:hypothetical protein